MTENRQLMLTVLDNNIKGDRVPYFSAREIENAIKTAYELAGIDEDHKQVPSYQQITCTLQSLIAEGLVISLPYQKIATATQWWIIMHYCLNGKMAERS